MARAGAQKLEPEGQEQKRRKQAQLDLSFLQIPALTAAPRIPEAELLRYEQLALSRQKQGPSWREFLRQVLESPLPGRSTMDEYLAAAVSARPIPTEKPESVSHVIREMVATKVPGQPRLKPDAVKDSIRLAALLESGRINFRRDWCGEEKVV